MSLLNYISKFLLFRWLVARFKKSTTGHDAVAGSGSASVDRDDDSLNHIPYEAIPHVYGTNTPVSDYSIDDSDDSEELDDLDIFMRDNPDVYLSGQHQDYGRDYHDSRHHSGYHNWNSGSHSQSYDDFHDEQDDYDMMDDGF